MSERADDSAGKADGQAEKPADGRPTGPAAPCDDLARLVAEHHVAVYRYAFRLTGSAADAEDLVQQTFLIAHQKREQVREVELVGRWLLAVVRNAFLKSRRRRVPMPAGGLEIDLSSVPARVADLPLAESLDVDQRQLQAAIDELPDEFKLPLVMFYFEECSYREISEQLDLPPGTVMSRLSRAKSHLRRRLFGEAGAEQESKGRKGLGARG